MPAGFFVRKQTDPRDSRSHAIARVWSSECAETNTALATSSRGKGVIMPVWMEILINLIGYGGFVAVATCHRPPGDELPDS
jgi:hypothetical protein